MVGKVSLSCKGKALLGVINKLLKTKSLLSSPSNVLPCYLKETFPPMIWIFTEGDRIKSRLPFEIISALKEKDSENKTLSVLSQKGFVSNMTPTIHISELYWTLELESRHDRNYPFPLKMILAGMDNWSKSRSDHHRINLISSSTVTKLQGADFSSAGLL